MSDTPLTQAERAEIEARLAAATPGEWHADQDQYDDWVVARDHPTIKGAAEVLFETDWGTEADAELIAHAPTDLARLLAENRARETENERLRVALQTFLALEEPDCRLDHHGYCQNHHVSRPCMVVSARRALAGEEIRSD